MSGIAPAFAPECPGALGFGRGLENLGPGIGGAVPGSSCGAWHELDSPFNCGSARLAWSGRGWGRIASCLPHGGPLEQRPGEWAKSLFQEDRYVRIRTWFYELSSPAAPVVPAPRHP